MYDALALMTGNVENALYQCKPTGPMWGGHTFRRGGGGLKLSPTKRSENDGILHIFIADLGNLSVLAAISILYWPILTLSIWHDGVKFNTQKRTLAYFPNKISMVA